MVSVPQRELLQSVQRQLGAAVCRGDDYDIGVDQLHQYPGHEKEVVVLIRNVGFGLGRLNDEVNLT